MAKDGNDSKIRSELDPLNESLFEHVNLGVWDLYIMRTRLSRYLPTSRKIEEYARIWKDVPYLWRTLRDISTVARLPLLRYLGITLANSLIPALSLWCVGFFFFESGRRLQIFKVFWTDPWNSEHYFPLSSPRL